MADKWAVETMPDQTGKSVVVTGANSGIGFESARALACKGAHVFLACRSVEKGRAAAQQILGEHPSATLTVEELDLASLASIGAFAERLATQVDRLDILINNAGVMALPYRQTADGFEMQFGTNHLGHFALTGLLLDQLLAASHARVVTVSSGLHRIGSIDFDDLNWQQSYGKWGAYARSKLANLLFAYELQRRLETAGAGAISVAAHPGYAATNLQTTGPAMQGSTLHGFAMKCANALFAQSASRGALPTLYAATAAEVRGGEYFGPDGAGESRGYPARVESNSASHDERVAARLWQESEALTGVQYSFAIRAPMTLR